MEGSFGDLLWRYRCAAGLSQEDLAARSGLSVDAISRLERGQRTAPRLTTVFLLAHGLGLAPAERDAMAAAARRRPGRPSIPADLATSGTGLVGRDSDMARVRDLLARRETGLLTLTGPPGVGKTRLALAAAATMEDRYRDGVVLVRLGAVREPALLMCAVGQALGVRVVGGDLALDAVAAHCRTRHLLLVLDNFEQLLTAAPELCELLDRCPDLQTLVTSRAALRVRPEHEFHVLPLALPTAQMERAGRVPTLAEVASVRLFVDRAAAVSGFRMGAGNASAVAAICRRLDGLPLALELAAPWLRLLTPDQLLERLDHRLDLLVAGAAGLPERQRTIRAAVGWSYDLLDEGPRTLLRRLSVFAGTAPLDALERVCEAPGELPGGVLRHLAVLADHSLVQGQEVAGAGSRVAMAEIVRGYARELLSAEELEAVAQAHLEYYVDLASRMSAECDGPPRSPWVERLTLEHDNLRVALGWAAECGRPEPGLRLARALWSFWDMGGHRREELTWLERLLASGPADPSVRAEALRSAGVLAWLLSSHQLSIARHREALEVFRALGDRCGAANSSLGLGLAIDAEGQHAAAIQLIEEAVSTFRELDDPAMLASALRYLGRVACRHGDGRRGAVCCEEALATARRIGDARRAAWCLLDLGDMARASGDASPGSAKSAAADARARYRESLKLFAGIGDHPGVAGCLRGLGWVAWGEGRASGAARLHGAADSLAPAPGAEGVGDEQSLAALRGELGEDRYAAAYDLGARLTMEAAVAEALSHDGCPDC